MQNIMIAGENIMICEYFVSITANELSVGSTFYPLDNLKGYKACANYRNIT